MLPASVSELLKEGKAAEDVLQEWPEITILFCYITGFKELTTSCDPYDVVDFVNSLFSSFDKVGPFFSCGVFFSCLFLSFLVGFPVICPGFGGVGERPIENARHVV